MEKIKTYDNLKKIIHKSFEWRHRNLSDTNSYSIKFKCNTKFNWFILIIAVTISILVKKISDDLVNAILTFTSIFATLIIPVLILVYDKFSKDPNSHLTEVQKKTEIAKERYKLHKNFTNRYIFVTLENIIISVIIICLIIVYKALLINYFDIEIFDYSLKLENNHQNIILFGHLSSVILMKTIFTILMIKFIYFLFFSIGAIGDFFISVLKEDE